MSATLHTDVGDIKIELFCDQCPKACESVTLHTDAGDIKIGLFFEQCSKACEI